MLSLNSRKIKLDIVTVSTTTHYIFGKNSKILKIYELLSSVSDNDELHFKRMQWQLSHD